MKDSLKRVKYLHGLELCKRKLYDDLCRFKSKVRELEKQQGLKELRSSLAAKSSEVEHLENEVELLKEDVAAQRASRPEWTERLLKKNRSHSTLYPNEYVAASIDLMAQGSIDASKMSSVMETTFALWHAEQTPEDKLEFARGRTFARWREGVPFLCLIQIGQLLSANAKELTIIQDGTPDDGHHVEAFTVHLKDMTIKSFPWIQPDKRSETSADAFKDMISLSLLAYKTAYEACSDKTNLVHPKSPGQVLSAICVLMSDNAPNEEKRAGIVEGWTGHTVISSKCLHHTLMLAAKDVRKACHKSIIATIGVDRDKRIGEFQTSNVVDSLQIQLNKEFGHLDPYAFGHGAVDFPTWMQDNHPGMYIGMDRIVGNRSMVFVRNALVHNYMAAFYIEFLDHIVGGGEYNRLQLKTLKKIGCHEVNISCIVVSKLLVSLILVHDLHPIMFML